MKPNKLELSSVDGTQLNLEALYQIAPSCFTEVKDDKTGELRHVVNFKTLRQLLGDNAVEDADEMYQFTWPGKQEARREAARPITKTLRPVVEDSVDWDNTQNLYIEGDNLEVLKLLQKSYMGKVKMIYIDPPYNTGNDFVYDDDFARSQNEEELASGNVDELGNRYRKNTDTNGRFHSDWCSMMYSRLMVARSLLTDDGVIFISIDDNEQRNLKNICDEIFGSSNFIAQLIWERAYSPKNDAKYISNSHDYVLMYALDLEKFTIGRLPRTEEANARYSNPDNDPRGVWKASDMSVKTYTSSCDYKITTPSGKIVEPPAGRCWSLSAKAFAERLQDNRIWFGPNGDSTPSIKRFLSELKYEGMAPTSILFYKEVGHSQEGAKEVVSLFGNKGVFDGPKPVRLLERLITLANLKSDSIVMDFFSGSATTAHALMKVNAEKQTSYKFILVQLPEEVSETKKEQGYKTICGIGKERIRRAGKKIKEESPLTTQNLDTGFRVFRLADSNFEEVKKAPAEYDQAQLDLFLNNVKSDRTDLDLLFGAMLSWGVQLSLPMTSEEVDGKMIYSVNDGDLVACFADDITENIVKAMADKQPLRVLFRDSCFARDDAKINVFETLKQLLDWSEEEAIKNIKVI
ncbi:MULTISPECIES: site-specific DNA-methyltransferase [Bacteroides]|uniref:site-specific DNA-methyltransferase n=1 Tax=Bacteroides TaxID=816 RepID=UPI000B3881AF|nr:MULTISPECIES: DNA methyltransferase [Bacteroides]MBM6943833.1 site-specific DNA-methyltransferase [Bacteroides gallinaceum]OUO63265.1 site-specific DNA-methyltransferase [Bacteroides sp. An279]